MAKILLQTTIAYDPEDWHAGKFVRLTNLLSQEHDVTARDREARADGSDPVLSALDESDYDQLWLLAVDRANGLAPQDVRGILRFHDKGRSVLTARDHENRGASILNLGVLGAVNNFSKYNRERERRRFVRDSGPAGAYHRIVPMEPVHEVLRSRRAPAGVVEYFPANPHEGALSIPAELPHARVIATGLSRESGREFNLAVAIDRQGSSNGHASGRAMALSSFHQLTDSNWDGAGDPEKLEIFKEYILNLARWL